MATIHHATVKSAASKGFVLTGGSDDSVNCLHTASGIAVTLEPDEAEGSATDLAKDAWATCGDMVAFQEQPENAGWKVAQVDGEFVATQPDGEQIEAESWDDLVQAIREAQENMAAEDLGDDGETEATGSVVPQRYKEQYKHSGVKDSCGDFLAIHMARFTKIVDGKVERVDPAKVELLCSANGLDYPSPETGNRGWEGRYRMTARNMLTKRVADAGKLVVPAGLNNGEQVEIEAPAEWVAKNMSAAKRKALAKVQAEEAAEAAKLTSE